MPFRLWWQIVKLNDALRFLALAFHKTGRLEGGLEGELGRLERKLEEGLEGRLERETWSLKKRDFKKTLRRLQKENLKDLKVCAGTGFCLNGVG